MPEIIADLEARIGANIDDMQKGLSGAKSQLTDFASGLRSTGAQLTAGFTTPVVTGLGLIVKSAAESESAVAQLDAVLKSTSSTAKQGNQSMGYWSDGTKNAAALTAKYGDDLAMANARLADMNAKLADGGKLSNVQQLNMEKLKGSINEMTGEIEKAAASGKKWVSTTQQQTQVSHMTRQAYIDLASGLEEVTRFSDETILGAENMLLTFTKIGKEVFPLATETVLDMSQALGQDAKNSAIQLGKALNDPIRGVTALQRVGVTFSEGQKRQIEQLVRSNKLMEAQKLILQELQTEFGGSARAAGETFVGSLDRVNNMFGRVLETIGTPIIAALTPILDGLALVMAGVADELARVDPEMIVVIAGVLAFTAAIPPLILLLGMLISPIGLLVTAVGLVAAAFATNFGGITDTVKEVIAFVKPELEALGSAMGKFWTILSGDSTFSQTNGTADGATRGWRQERTKGNASPSGEGTGGAGGLETFGQRFSQAFELAWPDIEMAIGNLFNKIGEWINTQGAPRLQAALTGMWNKAVESVKTSVQDAFLSAVNSLLNTIGLHFTKDGYVVGGVSAAFLNAFNWIRTTGVELARTAAALIASTMNAALNTIGSGIVAGVVAALRALAALISGVPGGGALGSGINMALDAAGYAAGGYPDAMKPIIVGERGAEIFVPQTAGRVIPNGSIGGLGGGGTVINIQQLTLQGVQDPDSLLDQLQIAAGRRNVSLIGAR